MEWTDQGIVLSARPHGEGGMVVALLTHDHGRPAGFVPGGGSRRARPTWRYYSNQPAALPPSDRPEVVVFKWMDSGGDANMADPLPFDPRVSKTDTRDYGLALVTRNVSDFEATVRAVLNPWAED